MTITVPEIIINPHCFDRPMVALPKQIAKKFTWISGIPIEALSPWGPARFFKASLSLLNSANSISITRICSTYFVMSCATCIGILCYFHFLRIQFTKYHLISDWNKLIAVYKNDEIMGTNLHFFLWAPEVVGTQMAECLQVRFSCGFHSFD